VTGQEWRRSLGLNKGASAAGASFAALANRIESLADQPPARVREHQHINRALAQLEAAGLVIGGR
jgi:hypothetical protein